MKRRYIGAFCILLGLVVIAFPFMKAWNENGRQQKILDAWKQLAVIMDDTESTSEPASASANWTEPENVMGILKIPAIELEQPVLNGANEHNLSLSLAAIEPGEVQGADGNLAIAGHNSRTYGRHFNRLSELKTGDLITLETSKQSYRYQVTGSFIVDAEDVWVLEDTLDEAEITLITCFYPKEGETQRFIIKGIGNQETEYESKIRE